MSGLLLHIFSVEISSFYVITKRNHPEQFNIFA